MREDRVLEALMVQSRHDQEVSDLVVEADDRYEVIDDRAARVRDTLADLMEVAKRDWHRERLEVRRVFLEACAASRTKADDEIRDLLTSPDEFPLSTDG